MIFRFTHPLSARGDGYEPPPTAQTLPFCLNYPRMVPPVGLSPTSLPSNGEALVFDLQQYIKETPVFQDLHSRVGNNGIEPLFQPENGCVLTLDEFPNLLRLQTEDFFQTMPHLDVVAGDGIEPPTSRL